jgi:hypothetical protein
MAELIWESQVNSTKVIRKPVYFASSHTYEAPRQVCHGASAREWVETMKVADEILCRLRIYMP